MISVLHNVMHSLHRSMGVWKMCAGYFSSRSLFKYPVRTFVSHNIPRCWQTDGETKHTSDQPISRVDVWRAEQTQWLSSTSAGPGNNGRRIILFSGLEHDGTLLKWASVAKLRQQNQQKKGLTSHNLFEVPGWSTSFPWYSIARRPTLWCMSSVRV